MSQEKSQMLIAALFLRTNAQKQSKCAKDERINYLGWREIFPVEQTELQEGTKSS